MMGQNIRVLICDDQALIRDGLEMLLKLERDIEVVGLAGDGAEVVEQVAKQQPDLAPRGAGVLVSRREYEDLYLRQLSGQTLGGLQPVHVRHRQVHEHHVGLELPCQGDRLAAIPCLSDYLDALRFKQAAEPITEQGVVIGDEDAHRSISLSASFEIVRYGAEG